MWGRGSLYLLALLTAAAFLWSYWTRVDISVRARGIVRPEGDAVKVVAPLNGRIQSVPTKEGSKVRRGDTILELDTFELVLQTQALESQIRLIERQLASLETRLHAATIIARQTAAVDHLELEAAKRAARASLGRAQARFARVRQLVEEGLAPRETYDEGLADLRRAEAEEARLSPQSLELKKTQGEARLRELAAEAEPLDAEQVKLVHQLEQLRFEIDRRTIRSPVAGEITFLTPMHVGEVLSSGTLVATIVQQSQRWVVESWLPAPERPHVGSGQYVRLQTGEFDYAEGTILYISPDSVKDVYRVTIAPAPSSSLHLGMTLEVHFIVREIRVIRAITGFFTADGADNPYLGDASH